MSSWETEQEIAWGQRRTVGETVQSAFMNRVYQYMALGLAATGLTAMMVARSEAALVAVLEARWVLLIAQLGVVLFFSTLVRRLSSAAAVALFLGYSVLTGLTMSFIFVLYTGASIASTFFVTGATFAAMSVYGATTKRDLTSIGGFLFMGLIGVVIASVVNLFLKSPAVYWVTTYAGILVFVGLTAWDTQKLKAYAQSLETEEEMKKGAVNGALMLYLDFINLFLLLLRILGRRR